MKSQLIRIANSFKLLYTRTSEVDFQFQAYKIGIGYQYKKIEILAGTYLVMKHKTNIRNY
jgi:hypothetical protein